MDFPARLRRLREEKGLTQAELGHAFSLSKQAISSYERGGSQPDTETLGRLADFFGCSVDYLLGRSDVRNVSVPTEDSLGRLAVTQEERRLLDATRHLTPDAITHLAEFLEYAAVTPDRAVKDRPSEIPPDKVVLFRRSAQRPPSAEEPGPLPDTDLHAARRTGDEELAPETWELIKKAQEEVRRKHGGPDRRGTPPKGDDK